MKHNDIEKLFHNRLEGLSPDDFPFEESAWDDVESTLNKEGILMPSRRKWINIFSISLLLLLVSNGLVGWKYLTAKQEIQTLNATVLQLENHMEKALMQKKSFNTITNPITKTEIVATNEKATFNAQIIEKIVYVPVESPSLVQSIVDNNLGSLDKSNNELGNSFSSSTITNASNSSKLPFNYPNKKRLNIQKLDNHLDINSDIDIQKNDDENTETQIGEHNITDIENANKLASPTGNIENSISETENTKESIDFLKLIELTHLDVPFDTLNMDNRKNLIVEPSKRKPSIVDYLRLAATYVEVSNYEIGLSNGYDFLHQNTDFNVLSTRLGLTGEVRFSDYVKIGTSVDWRQTTAELADIDQISYPNEFFDVFPNLTSSLSLDDVLSKIEYNDNAIEFALFAKYLIHPNATWTPYLGGGVRGEYDYQQRFEYKYLLAPNFITEYETDYVYLNNQQLGFNTIMAMIGMEYQILPNFTLRFEALYNYDYKPHRFDNSQLQWFCGNIGVLYKFRPTKMDKPNFR